VEGKKHAHDGAHKEEGEEAFLERTISLKKTKKRHPLTIILGWGREIGGCFGRKKKKKKHPKNNQGNAGKNAYPLLNFMGKRKKGGEFAR